MSRRNPNLQHADRGYPAPHRGQHHRGNKNGPGGGVAETVKNRPEKPMGLNSSSTAQRNHNQHKAPSARRAPSVNPTLDYPFLQDDRSIVYINGSRVMFILRGLAGSGKTTLAQAIQAKYNKVLICSADEFFISNGMYRFDRNQLPDAHDWCKRKAQKFCENGKYNTIIIDNTNTQLWELEHYLDVANENNFAVLLVEPRTSWRWDVAQLEKKNVHNIPAAALKKKMAAYEEICPEYFGWFLNEADTQMLHSIAQAYLDEFSRNADFMQDFAKWAPKSRDLKKYFSGSSFNETRQVFHCTTHYIGNECNDDEYSHRKAVINSTGKVYTLRVVGFVVTPRTFGARLMLEEEALKLWNQNDTEGGPGGCDSLANNMKQLNLQDGSKRTVNSCKKRANGQCPSTIPTLHWTRRVHYQKRFHPTSGRGSRAHITLGCGNGAKAVETGYDVVNIIHCEKRANDTPPNMLFHVHEGVAGTYGNGQWVVYLNKQIEVKALFTGAY